MTDFFECTFRIFQIINPVDFPKILPFLDQYEPGIGLQSFWYQDSYKTNTIKFLKHVSMKKMSRLITCLWFVNNDGEEAIKYYIDTFKSAPGNHEAKLGDITKSPKASEEVSGRPEGSVLTAECELDGISFMALNGGPYDPFKLNGSTSFIIECETQEEIDFFWEKLSAVPKAEQCGWCRDKFGVTWQVVPRILDEMMRDPQKAEAVTAAFMPMKKIDLETIKRAGE